MSKIIPVFLVLLLATSTDRAKGQTPVCRDWNPEQFLRSATLADIETCLESGVDLEALGSGGYKPLELAAMYSSPEVAGEHIGAGAEVDPRPRSYRTPTPLDLAPRFNGNPRMVEVLIRAGAHMGNDRRLAGPARPLHWAAENDNVQVAEALIRAGAEVDAVGYWELNQPSASSDGQFATPLIVAVAKGRPSRGRGPCSGGGGQRWEPCHACRLWTLAFRGVGEQPRTFPSPNRGWSKRVAAGRGV